MSALIESLLWLRQSLQSGRKAFFRYFTRECEQDAAF